MLSQSFTASLPDFTQSEGSKTKSKKSYKKSPRLKLSTKPSVSKTLKVRIYLDSDLHKFLKKLLAATRLVYNKAIEQLKNGFNGSRYDLRDYIKKLDLPQWVKEVPEHPKEYAMADAYDTYWRAKQDGGEAKFRSCRSPKQTIKFHQRNYSNGFWFPSLTKKFKYWASEEIPVNCGYSTQITRDRGRWFACFPKALGDEKAVTNKVIALDPGVRTFLTGYDGESFIEFGKADIGRIYRLCSHLDKLIHHISKTKSHRHKTKLSRASQKLRNKIKNKVDECHRQTANYLTKEYKIIFLPTFETSQMVVKKGRKLATKTARAMLTWSHYRFKQFLKYKAKSRGCIVVDCNESYTSRTCPHCGHKHDKLGGNHTFKCPECGTKINRDWNGARNIMLRALRDGSFFLNLNEMEIAIAFDTVAQYFSA
ncbi:MAG: transposase [Cyanobacteria bacterium P01_D01_bin.50]